MEHIGYELRQVDPSLLSAHNQRGAADSLFEVWLLTLLASTAVELGMDVSWKQRVWVNDEVSERGVTELRVRKSQGDFGVFEQPGWTYLVIEAAGAALEVHVDIRVTGVSGVAHEGDLVALPADLARLLAELSCSRPNWRHVVAVVEAKWLSSTLDPVHGRAFVTLLQELQPQVRGLLVCSQDGPTCRTLIDRLTANGRFVGGLTTKSDAGVAAIRAEYTSMLLSWYAARDLPQPRR
ncbi:MAG: hypothetical protein ABW167_18975 [Baekduia sp.]